MKTVKQSGFARVVRTVCGAIAVVALGFSTSLQWAQGNHRTALILTVCCAVCAASSVAQPFLRRSRWSEERWG